MNSLLAKRYHQEIERTHRHHDCSRKGRVDGRRGSVRQRLQRFCHNDAVGRFTAVLSLGLSCEEIGNPYYAARNPFERFRGGFGIN